VSKVIDPEFKALMFLDYCWELRRPKTELLLAARSCAYSTLGSVFLCIMAL